MNTLGDNVDEQAVGGDGSVRRTRSARVAVAVGVAVVVALLGIVSAPAFASAAPADAVTAAASLETPASASPSPTSTPVPQNQLSPAPPTTSPARPPVRPAIDDPGDITSGTVRLSGTGTAGHVLRVSSTSTGGPVCAATVRQDGSWACIATVRSGPQQVFTVRDATAPTLGTGTTPASDVIVPPVVTTSRPTSGLVAGTGYPGSTIALSVAGSTSAHTAEIGADGLWRIALGGAVADPDARRTVTATQTGSTADGYRSELRSAASSPVVVEFDRTAPAAPRITTPVPGARLDGRTTTVAGTGEAGAVLTVYIDRAPVCRTIVRSSGGWSCTTPAQTSAPGSHTVTANQQDAAGNFSRTSTAVRVVLAQVSGAPSGSPVPSGTPAASAVPTSPGGSSGTSTPPTGGTSTSTPGGTPGGGSSGPGGGAGGTGTGGTGDQGTSSGAHRPDWSGPAGDWAASTAYDSTVPTIQTAFSWRTVIVATALAAGFLVLIAGPLALVAGAVRGRVRSPFAGLLGRNRPHAERRRGDDVLPTWAAIAIAVLVVGFSTLLGVGVSLEARYVRLTVAVLLGAALLTTTVVLASRWAAGADRRTTGFRVSPWLVLAALVACCVTRSFDLSPALVVGTVLVPVGRPRPDTAGLRLGSSIASGARSATWRSTALLVVAAAGWVLHSLTPGSGFWASFVSEFATTLCVGGLGAVVVTMLPLTGSTGQALLAQSTGRYVAIAAVAVALAAAVYSGSAGVHAPPATLVAAAAACTSGAVAVLVRRRLLLGGRRI